PVAPSDVAVIVGFSSTSTSTRPLINDSDATLPLEGETTFPPDNVVLPDVSTAPSCRMLRPQPRSVRPRLEVARTVLVCARAGPEFAWSEATPTGMPTALASRFADSACVRGEAVLLVEVAECANDASTLAIPAALRPSASTSPWVEPEYVAGSGSARAGRPVVSAPTRNVTTAYAAAENQERLDIDVPSAGGCSI